MDSIPKQYSQAACGWKGINTKSHLVVVVVTLFIVGQLIF